MKQVLMTNQNLAASSAVRYDEGTNTVRSTKDYAKFCYIKGNRDIRPAHYRKLIERIEKNNLLQANPIVVNELMQVVDGQHRLKAAQQLGVPVYYVVVPGLGLKDVQDTNAVSATWSNDEYARSYVAVGNPHYVQYVKFRERYKFGHREAITILTGITPSGRRADDGFADGTLIIKDIDKSNELAEKILEFEEFYPKGVRRRNFVVAMLRLNKLPAKIYDHETMKRKVAMQQTRLVDCVTADEYVLLLERLYNFKAQRKVRFTY